MSWWKLIYWLIGTFGVAGTIALAVAYPLVLTSIWRAIIKVFSFVLSYRVGCAVVAAALAWFIADYYRHSVEDAKHAAEIAAFEQAQDNRDKRIKQETRELVLSEQLAAVGENKVTDNAVKDFKNAIPPVPPTGNPFRVGADFCRLREIYGQPRCGSDGIKGVPQAHADHEGGADRGGRGLSSLVRRSRGRVEQGQ